MAIIATEAMAATGPSDELNREAPNSGVFLNLLLGVE